MNNNSYIIKWEVRRISKMKLLRKSENYFGIQAESYIRSNIKSANYIFFNYMTHNLSRFFFVENLTLEILCKTFKLTNINTYICIESFELSFK